MSLARWWQVVPSAFAGLTAYDLQQMSEFRDRVEEAEAERLRKLKWGLPLEDGKGPKKGDIIVVGGKEVRKGDGW